jgi:hypothetical protein
MTAQPRFGFAADPRALTDLMQAPAEIRDQALLQLQDVVNGSMHGAKLTGDLNGYRKIYVDLKAEWRIVYAQRPAPAQSAHPQEIYLVAVRPKARNNIYDTVAARLGIDRRPVSALTHAARARSPQSAAHRPPALAVSVPQPVRPQAVPSTKGRAR